MAWQTKNDSLNLKLEFKDFVEAMDFVTQVADLAEIHNHHPSIKIDWNKVELVLTTHSEGGKITKKDRNLAKSIDDLLDQNGFKKTEPIVRASKVQIYTDGGSRGNPGPSAAGYALLDKSGTVLKKSGIYLGITTNNQAEYQSLKLGLEEAIKIGAQEAEVYMDSLLVVNQMKGIFKVKNRDLWPIHTAIKQLEERFKKISYTHVPREMNKLADSMVNETLDAEKELG
jgi:ribonuclease HI/pterin-4a-carbinolamine dehydratase